MHASIARYGIELTAMWVIGSTAALGQVNVVTNRYDQSRTAANLNETILNTSNVNTATFGKLGSYSVDGVIYAQPLYAQGVMVNGVPHNVLYVATMHDVLYAFDADNIGSLPLWTVDFRNPAQGISPAPLHIGIGDGTDTNVADTLGILSTPVIDLPNNRMYLVTHTLENGTECFRLREIDIGSGALLNSTLITATVPAMGGAPSVSLVPANYGQRPALEYADGQIWISFGSRPTGDYLSPWYGWVLSYDPNTLLQTSVFATSRTNGDSIWQSGSGPAIDASGNIYYVTANGGVYDGVTEFPESLLKFSYGPSLNLVDWYTPDNTNGNGYYLSLNNYDLDLSVTGPMLIPGTDLIAFGSKTGDVYVLFTENLGHLTPFDTQLAQFFHVGAAVQNSAPDADEDRIVGMAFWQSPAGGTLYVWPGTDSLHAYKLNTATSTFTESYEGTFDLPGAPSTALSISANGSTGGTGILWAPVMNVTFGANSVGHPGILHAYNAENPAQELWNSNMVSSDNMGTLAKFVPAMVANGKVYVANSALVGNYGAGSVTVYGLKSNLSSYLPPAIRLTSPATASTYVSGSPIVLSANAAGQSGRLASISFLDGTTTLATLPATADPGNYSFTWTVANIGSHTLTAIATDVTGAVKVSSARTINVIGTPTYSVAASPASIVLSPGGTATTTITVTPLAGFSGQLSLGVFGLNGSITGESRIGDASNTYVVKLTALPNAAPQSTSVVITTGAGGQPNSLVLPIVIANSGAAPGFNTFSVTLPSPATLGTPIAFSEGVPSSALANPDFTLVTGGATCTGSVSNSCVVQIKFTPQFEGLRRGAFEIVDTSNNVLATYFFFGNGAGTLPIFVSSSAAPTANPVYSPAAGSPSAVAIDGAGDVFAIDAVSNQLVEIAAGGSVQTIPLGVTLNSPSGLALDAAGDIYVADTGNNRVLELPYGASSATALNVTGLSQPQGLAVDGAGNLFTANSGAATSNGIGNVIEVQAGSGTQSIFFSNGLNMPSAVAVDAAGDVFIADKNNSRVLEVQTGGQFVQVGSGFSAPSGVAVDGAGDVFVVDQANSQLAEVFAAGGGPGTGAQTTLASGLQMPAGIALDASGKAYVADLGSAGSTGNVLQVGVLVPQSISLGFVPTLVAGGPTATISASASSGLPVTLTPSSTAVCTVSGNVITPVGQGTCTITATQPGNSIYSPAPPVSTSFQVTAAVLQPQAITFGAIATQGLGGLPLNLGATASSGLPVTYTAGPQSVCSISGSAVTLAGRGTCTVTASQAGNSVWAAATPVAQSFGVQLNVLVNGGVEGLLAPWHLSLFGDGSGTVSLSNAVFIDGASSADIDVLTVGSYANHVDWEQGSIPLIGGALYTLQFWAKADIAHPVTVRCDGVSPSYPFYGLVQNYSVGTTWTQYTATFTASATTTTARLEFNFATGAGNVWIDDVQLFPASALTPQAITWPQQANVAYGAKPLTLGASATSGLSVAYASNTPGVCTVSGTQATLVTPGTCSITATQPGDSLNAAATPVTQSFTVTPLAQTITFPAIGAVTYGIAPFSISATATSNLPVSFASNAPAVCTVSGNQVTVLAGGSCSITASQSGNTYYGSATPVTQSFTVAPQAQTINFPVLGGVTLGAAPFSIQATATSTLTVSFTSNSLPACTVSGNQVTVVNTGTCSITASQGGNASFAAATPMTQAFAISNASQLPQTISFGAIATQGLGGLPMPITASTTSGLAVSFNSNSASVCTIAGTSVSLLSAGTCSITATQNGNGTYAPAAPVTQTFNVAPNLIANGGFEGGSLKPWLFVLNAPAAATAVISSAMVVDGTSSAALNVTQTSSNGSVDFYQSPLTITAGKTYVVQFWAVSSAPRTIQVDAEAGSPNWTNFGLNTTLPVGTTWTHYTYTFAPTVSATNGRLEFHLGSSSPTVWLDDVQLYQQN